jgi:hypothetical protein
MVGYSTMIPLFSATNTRPSGEKRTTVGRVRPVRIVVSVYAPWVVKENE